MFRIKNKFLDLLEKSVITQAILTIGVVGVCLYMFATGREVPPTLIQWAAFLMGLYGAAKVHSLTKGDKA